MSETTPTPETSGAASQPVPVIIGNRPLQPGELQMKAPRRGKPPIHLADFTATERVEWLKSLGHQGFRAKQLSKHYFEHYTTDPALMTDLPASQREELVALAFPRLLTEVSVQLADQGRTVKTLWRLHDGSLVESVLMRYRDRTTICVSSQAGCGMNCPFCATGQAGLTRNMSTAEIIEQVRVANQQLAAGEIAGGPGRVNNLVFMGMGEPMANYKAVAGAVHRLTDVKPEGFGMSARGVTVSTVGLLPAIEKLTAEGIPCTLAISIHAPDDELRDELVPINQRYKIDDVLDAARKYFDTTGRRVSIEYALIRDINDQAWRADLLGRMLTARGGAGWIHVNPIPLNPVPNSKWTASDPRVEQEFVETLRSYGIATTIRDTRGSDIDGACGQLAATVVEDDKHREDREARVGRVELIAAATQDH